MKPTLDRQFYTSGGGGGGNAPIERRGGGGGGLERAIEAVQVWPNAQLKHVCPRLQRTWALDVI